MPGPPDRILTQALALPRTAAGTGRLVDMLRVNARHFKGLSSADAEWLRGQLLAALGERQVPNSAVGLIEEELRTSDSPVVLAGAARAMRRCGPVGAGRRRLIESARGRIAGRDQFVSFGAAGEAPALTAREELEACLRGNLAAEGQCCGGAAAPVAAPAPRSSREALAAAEVEDQDGRRITLAELAAKRPILIALFYTRCMNPEKCSATIVGLGRLVRHLAAERDGPDLQVIGLSYDGAYDIASRLRDYGTDRSFPFGDRALLARCTRGWPALRRALDLQVGYGDATVNYHEREIFLVETCLTLHRVPPAWLAEPAQLLAGLEARRRPLTQADVLGDQRQPDRV